MEKWRRPRLLVLEVRKLGEIGVCENIWRAVWCRHSRQDTPPAPSSGTEGKAPGPVRFRLEQPQVHGPSPCGHHAQHPPPHCFHPRAACPTPVVCTSKDQHTFCSVALDTSCTVPLGCG